MNVLVVFAKDPSPGRSKTRLARSVGQEAASQLARALLVDTLEAVRSLNTEIIRPGIAYAPDDAAARDVFADLAGDLSREPQRGAGLGDRLRNCFEEWFRRGASRVIAIGTDCPTLGPAEIEKAFDRLKRNQCVLGPASDGGYYLVGLSATAGPDAAKELFDGVAWDSPRVLRQTAGNARRLRLSLGVLPVQSDVDEVEDLEPAFGHLESLMSAHLARGQATYWTLQSLLSRPEHAEPPPYEFVDFADVEAVPCPCGSARRAFTEATDFPATVHVTEISEDAAPHRHARQTEVYYVLEAGPDARMRLNDEEIPVRPGQSVLIRPGTVHRAVGKMKVLIICSPKFDPNDEEIMG